MKYNPHAPASKQDVQTLIHHVGQLYLSCREWKEEIVRELRRRVLVQTKDAANNADSHESRFDA